VDERKGIEKYAEGRAHPQVAEIEKHLQMLIDSFEPHIVYPLWAGIVAVITAQIEKEADISSLYRNSVHSEPFIKLVDFHPTKEINIVYLRKRFEEVGHTNFCHVSFVVNGNAITIISTLDNLVKGGSGQAVQNFNLMHGFDETLGL